MNYNNLVILDNYDNGEHSYSIRYKEIGKSIDESPILCTMPTLEKACSLVRYLNGGNMSSKELAKVEADISEITRKRKAAACTD